MTGVGDLAGFTVGVTAARRAEELGSLFVRRGATVRYGPAIRIVPLSDDTELVRATSALLDAPVDVVVATTGIGLRGWIEAAESWGLGRALLETLSAATVLARGPKVTGAVRAVGLCESYAPGSARTAELLRHLLDLGVAGARIAVQLHGQPQRDFVDTLRRSGADVVEIPVYRWVGPADPGPLDRLVDGVLDGTVDALPFTSAPAAASVLARAERTGRREALVRELTRRVVVGCVGPTAAAPLEAAGVPTVRPDSARIGALAHTVAGALRERSARWMTVAGHRVEMRGQGAVVDGEWHEIAAAPMAVLRALAERPGRVVSRRALLARLPHGGDEHAVETAVGRLRSALGGRGLVRTVVKRGYRLAVDVNDPAGGQRPGTGETSCWC